jgi:hypothetical protein
MVLKLSKVTQKWFELLEIHSSRKGILEEGQRRD